MNWVREWLRQQQARRDLIWHMQRYSDYAAGTGKPRFRRSHIRAAVRGWSASAVDLMLHPEVPGFEFSDYGAEIGWGFEQGVPPEHLWGMLAVAPNDCVPWDRWACGAKGYHARSIPAFLGILHDPESSSRLLKPVTEPHADAVRRLGAVIAVIANCQSRSYPDRSPVVHYAEYNQTRMLAIPMPQITCLANHDLAELIWHRPEQAGRIADLMHERGTDDLAVITEILDSPASVLSGGAL